MYFVVCTYFFRVMKLLHKIDVLTISITCKYIYRSPPSHQYLWYLFSIRYYIYHIYLLCIEGPYILRMMVIWKFYRITCLDLVCQPTTVLFGGTTLFYDNKTEYCMTKNKTALFEDPEYSMYLPNRLPLWCLDYHSFIVLLLPIFI